MDVVVKRVLLVFGVLLVPAGVVAFLVGLPVLVGCAFLALGCAAGFAVKSTLWRGQHAGWVLGLSACLLLVVSAFSAESAWLTLTGRVERDCLVVGHRVGERERDPADFYSVRCGELVTEHVENGLRAPRVGDVGERVPEFVVDPRGVLRGKLPEEVRALAVWEVGGVTALHVAVGVWFATRRVLDPVERAVARARERVAREFD